MLGVPASMLIIPLAWKLAPRLGMVDTPDPRKVHNKPIPRIGGWGIVAGSLFPITLMLPMDALLESYVAGALILFVFGLWDDARQVSHWVKFVGQLAAAAVVVWHGDLYVAVWPFFGDALPDWSSRCLTVVALMGMINAINHSDGLDGLAGGESILSLTAIAFLGFLCGNDLIIALAFATIGGILGFLRYNSHPAEVFMGDAGSQFLGFSLACLAIYLTQIAYPAVSMALPLLFLGLPISDILVVLYKRIKGKMNWFKATRNHVHHRLLDLGFAHFETVVVIYSVQATLVTLAVLLRFQLDTLVIGTYLLVVGALFGLLTLAESKGWKRHPGGSARFRAVANALHSGGALRRVPLLLITILLPGFLLAGATLADEVPRDIGIVAGVLLALNVVEYVFKRDRDSLTGRLSVYTCAVSAGYLFVNHASHSSSSVQAFGLAAIIVLAVAVAAFIRYTSEHRFGATPTDYLIAFGVVALVIFGRLDVRSHGVVYTVMYSVVLLYGCESLIGAPRMQGLLLRLGSLSTLALLAARGLL